MKQSFLIIAICCCCYCCTRCSSGKSITPVENREASAPAPSIPVCIQSMIDSAKKQPSGMAISEIRRYIFNGARIYVVTAPCCDQFNNAYDSACRFLFAPSGGMTGKGDRRQPDFFTQAKEDSVIWKAKEGSN